MKEYIIKVDDSKPDIDGSMPLMDKPKELIRCKDCKHARQMCQPWNDLVCEKNGQTNRPNFFCADGERWQCE